MSSTRTTQYLPLQETPSPPAAQASPAENKPTSSVHDAFQTLLHNVSEGFNMLQPHLKSLDGNIRMISQRLSSSNSGAAQEGLEPASETKSAKRKRERGEKRAKKKQLRARKKAQKKQAAAARKSALTRNQRFALRYSRTLGEPSGGGGVKRKDSDDNLPRSWTAKPLLGSTIGKTAVGPGEIPDVPFPIFAAPGNPGNLNMFGAPAHHGPADNTPAIGSEAPPFGPFGWFSPFGAFGAAGYEPWNNHR